MRLVTAVSRWVQQFYGPEKESAGRALGQGLAIKRWITVSIFFLSSLWAAKKKTSQIDEDEKESKDFCDGIHKPSKKYVRFYMEKGSSNLKKKANSKQRRRRCAWSRQMVGTDVDKRMYSIEKRWSASHAKAKITRRLWEALTRCDVCVGDAGSMKGNCACGSAR